MSANHFKECWPEEETLQDIKEEVADNFEEMQYMADNGERIQAASTAYPGCSAPLCPLAARFDPPPPPPTGGWLVLRARVVCMCVVMMARATGGGWGGVGWGGVTHKLSDNHRRVLPRVRTAQVSHPCSATPRMQLHTRRALPLSPKTTSWHPICTPRNAASRALKPWPRAKKRRKRLPRLLPGATKPLTTLPYRAASAKRLPMTHRQRPVVIAERWCGAWPFLRFGLGFQRH